MHQDGLFHQQTAGDYSSPEDNHGGEYDFPGVHSGNSVACSWSIAAKTVLSISWERLLAGKGMAPGTKDQTVNKTISVKQGTAPRQRAPAHRPQQSEVGRGP